MKGYSLDLRSLVSNVLSLSVCHWVWMLLDRARALQCPVAPVLPSIGPGTHFHIQQLLPLTAPATLALPWLWRPSLTPRPAQSGLCDKPEEVWASTPAFWLCCKERQSRGITVGGTKKTSKRISLSLLWYVPLNNKSSKNIITTLVPYLNYLIKMP